MPYIEAYDPGKASGLAHGYYDDATPFELDGVMIIGPEAFEDYIWEWGTPAEPTNPIRVYEGFRLRSGNKFTADLTGVELIGQMKLVARKRGIMLHKQMPTDKALVHDSVLKAAGIWQTGKMVGHADGRDANDAIIHILAYLKKIGHVPTIEHYWPETLEA